MKMKKKFGLELIALVFIFGGCVAQAEPPEAGNYRVSMGGGHMEEGDIFVLIKGGTNEELVLDPDGNFPETMNKRWKAVGNTPTN